MGGEYGAFIYRCSLTGRDQPRAENASRPELPSKFLTPISTSPHHTMSRTLVETGHLAGSLQGDSIQLRPLGKNQSDSEQPQLKDLSASALSLKEASESRVSVFETPSRPDNNGPGDGAARTMTREMAQKERLYFAAACVAMFVGGWNE